MPAKKVAKKKTTKKEKDIAEKPISKEEQELALKDFEADLAYKEAETQKSLQEIKKIKDTITKDKTYKRTELDTLLD